MFQISLKKFTMGLPFFTSGLYFPPTTLLPIVKTNRQFILDAASVYHSNLPDPNELLLQGLENLANDITKILQYHQYTNTPDMTTKNISSNLRGNNPKHPHFPRIYQSKILDSNTSPEPTPSSIPPAPQTTASPSDVHVRHQ